MSALVRVEINTSHPIKHLSQFRSNAETKPMNNFVQSFYTWYRNTIRNPKYRWWLVLGSLLYLFSPIDLSPDIFPVIGWIDDAVVMTLLVSEVSQLLVEQVKLRQGSSSAKTVGNNGDSTTSDSTVDVDAVSVK
jgi:uncharacterized membrane protein YkvA (DUF1232 family)